MRKRTPAIASAVVALLMLGGCVTDADRARLSSNDVFDRPEVARSLMDAAASAAAQNDPGTAAGYYRSVYTRDPNNIRAAVGLLQSLREVGAIDQANSVATQILASKPSDAAIVGEVGKVRLAGGQLNEAIKLLQRAGELDAQDWKSRSALGVAYDRLGDARKAEESYQAALAVSPNNASVLNNFALSRAMANDLSTARDLLQRAVSSANGDLRVRQNLALIYALSGNMAQAEALTLRDLPPDAARETLAYYRELAPQPQ
jgi:Flp pilus assembly protein TadD